MNTGEGVRSGESGAAIAMVFTTAAVILMVLGMVVLAGCTSEADLVHPLSTTSDTTVRAQAAADLAKRHSLVATQQLVTAAAKDQAAVEGLDALAVVYGDVVQQAAQGVKKAGKEGFSVDAMSRLSATLDCLGAVGTDKAVEQLIKVGTGLGTDTYLNGLRGIAAGELGKIGKPAVEPLMALADEGDWARSALKSVGGDAVPALLEVLGEQKWAEEVLVANGSLRGGAA